MNSTATKSKLSKKKILVASIALLSIGFGGTIATGAWFTDSKTVAANQLTAGTVILGNLADDATSTTPLNFTNVIPVAASDVATKAQTFNINVRNVGTADIDWTAKLTPDVSTAASTAFAKQVFVQASTDGGSTWSTAQSISDFSGNTIASTSKIVANGSSVIQLRAWLPSTTDNTAQGQTLKFTLEVDAIQAGVPRS
ncbi:hypothetical protein JOE58_002639 [Curtobacterium luteum]|uniref:Camelysin metallo-endopeptidase n=3 Tax=Curtobacterium luteum TaxID=33881 RepID=A0ABS2RXM6_9MICO|nr:hypothetical protein [Curtobacterium luteum]MBM7803388.1 hypothetical protein [Curtobacterium luteum]